MPLACYNCGEAHYASECPLACWICGEFGHSCRACPNADLVGLRDLFQSLADVDNDVIFAHILRSKIADMGFSEEHVERFFRAVQHEREGEVSWPEFRQFAVSRIGYARHLFREMDENGSGSITRHEFKRALEKLRLSPTEEEVRLMIAKIDRPSGHEGACPPNGKIEWMEFRDFVLLASPRGRFLDFSPLADEWLGVASEEFMGMQSQGKVDNKALTAVNGGIALGFSRSCVAPLERLRLQMIVDGSKYRSTWECFASIYKQEGLAGYWRGNTINMIRIIPQGAVAFVAKDYFKQMLGGEDATSLQLACASMLAGMTCMTAIYPLDLVRGRVTTTPGVYRGMTHGLLSIARQEGPLALYRGLWPANAWAIPYYGVQFFTYDSLKKLYNRHSDSGKAGPGVGLVLGGCAGMTSTAAAFPFELTRRVLQTQGVGGRAVEYRGVFQAARGIVRKRGVSGLFSGLKANLIKSPIGSAIAFWAYETVNKLLDDHLPEEWR